MVNSSASCLKKLSKAEILCVGEDEHDKGGYFIISGKARTLATQARDAYNPVHVFEKAKVDNTYLISEMRSMNAETGHTMLIQVLRRVTISNLPFSDEPRHKSYDYRCLYVSLH